jgi:hypothetical protein
MRFLTLLLLRPRPALPPSAQIYELPAKTWLGGVAVGVPMEPLPDAYAGLDTAMARMQVAIAGERGPPPPPVGALAEACTTNGHQLFVIL